MKFTAIFAVFLSLLASSQAFQTTRRSVRLTRALPMARAEQQPQPELPTLDANLVKLLPAAAALSAAAPAHAEGMTAAFLPAIMTPLVGLIFPGLSMALFFLYSQKEDL